MHTRQSGAAHVNIFFFLIMLVLFLGAAGWAYVTLERANEFEIAARNARAETRDLKIQNLVYRHYVEDIATVIGETGEYTGRERFNYVDPDNTEVSITPTPLTNVVSPKRVETLIADFARQVGVAESKGLATFFGLIKNAFDSKAKVAADAQANAAAIAAELASQKTANSQITAEHRTREQQLNSELTQRSEDHSAQLAGKDQTIRTANAQYSDLREQMSSQAEQSARTVAGLEKEKENLTARAVAAANKTKLLNHAGTPDGMIISSSEATSLAWINLGRRDMLPVGTSFVISAPGKDEPKAYGSVVRVEQDRAEIRVTGLKDRYDPIVRGDTVRNDLYSPSMRHNIYLMGRFGHPYSRPMVKALLENLGNTVVEKLGPGVDLILVGADTINEDGSGFTAIEETEEYKTATALHIEMAPLSKVQPFLRLSSDDSSSSPR